MSRFNSATVIVSGNLTKDFKNIAAEGKSPCFVSRIAVDVSKKNSEGVYEKVRTDFFDVKSFEATVANFKSGNAVTLSGELITGTDKDPSGNARQIVQVLARSIESYMFPTKTTSSADEPVPA